MCVVSISHSLYIFFCRTSLPLRGVIINSRPITCVLSYLKPFLPVSLDLYRPPGFSSHIIITLCTMDLFTCNNIILWWWFTCTPCFYEHRITMVYRCSKRFIDWTHHLSATKLVHIYFVSTLACNVIQFTALSNFLPLC